LSSILSSGSLRSTGFGFVCQLIFWIDVWEEVCEEMEKYVFWLWSDEIVFVLLLLFCSV
jgi:hypothetical protein